MSNTNESQIVFTSEKVEEIRIKAEQGYKLTRQEKYWFEGLTLTKKDGIVFTLSDEESLEYAKCRLGIDIDGYPYTDTETQTLQKNFVK